MTPTLEHEDRSPEGLPSDPESPPAVGAGGTTAPAEPSDAAPAASSPEVEALEKVLSQKETYITTIEASLRETEGLLDRTRAAARAREKELDGVRQRLERDREKHLERSRLRILESFLEPMDNLERSLASAHRAQDLGDAGQALLSGLDMVLVQFQQRLRELGLDRFDPTGEPFDPAQHEAVATVPVDQDEHDGRVRETWQAGYRAGGTLLRAARVVVGRKAPVSGT